MLRCCNCFKDFYKIKDNFEFNEELEDKIKKDGNICDILFNILGSGFFCKIPYNENKINFLFTNNHVINEDLLLIGKKIRIFYKGEPKEIEITKNRLIWTDSRNYKEGLDYTCIQIFKEDGFNIKNFFEIENFNLSNYNGIPICILQYPKGNELTLKTGYIKELNNYEIFHSANTDHGSSGSPIISLNKGYKVIGIHRRFHKIKKLNYGSYIKYILQHIINFIICEYNITELNKPIQILNCYEEANKEHSWLYGINNENEIRNNCEIYVNDNKIDFTFKYEFSKKGNNKIIIKFKNNMTNMNHMFYNCSSLTSLNLSNFNINNVNYMEGIFSGLNEHCDVITLDNHLSEEFEH